MKICCLISITRPTSEQQTWKEKFEKFEGFEAKWSTQIEYILWESDRIRREADDNGPTAELINWRCRMFCFDILS